MNVQLRKKKYIDFQFEVTWYDKGRREHSAASLEEGKGGEKKKKRNGILVVPFPGRSHVSYGHGCAFVAKANRGAQLKRET